jgi:NAD(P)-dependent dehydrogenase (short-subunit alcohol dehydrogenase family)
MGRASHHFGITTRMKQGKIVVITGATRGLGRAMVEEFVREGHTVIGCGRSEQYVKELREQLGKPHDFYVVNVASEDDVQSWASLILSNYGPPDLLINNAAIINRNAPLWDVPVQEFNAVVDINIKGVANVIRCFVPDMVKRRSGVIVNFSSGWGRSVSPEVAPYCASKWAIEGLTRALAEELPDGLAAVPLNPGVIDTDMLRQAWADGAANYPKAIEWAAKAAAYILKLGPKDNGSPASVSGFED